MKKRAIFVGILLLSMVCLSCSPAPAIFGVEDNETKYQDSIALIQEEKWDEATTKLITLHDKNYKDAKHLYNYVSAKKDEEKQYYNQCAFYMKSIPDSYNGAMKDEILTYKKVALERASKLTTSQVAEELKKQIAEVDKYLEEHGKEPSKKQTPAKPNLELIETHNESTAYTRYVVGTVKNNSGHSYSYVQVSINLYDDSGAQVGSTLDNTNNLEPDSTWKFKAIILEDDATEYKITKVTGY